jgi:type II secretory pathway component PulF
MISGFRYGFLGINDVPLATTFGVLVVFIVAFYLLCWYLIQRGRGFAANLANLALRCPVQRSAANNFDCHHRYSSLPLLHCLPAKEVGDVRLGDYLS